MESLESRGITGMMENGRDDPNRANAGLYHGMLQAAAASIATAEWSWRVRSFLSAFDGNRIRQRRFV